MDACGNRQQTKVNSTMEEVERDLKNEEETLLNLKERVMREIRVLKVGVVKTGGCGQMGGCGQNGITCVGAGMDSKCVELPLGYFATENVPVCMASVQFGSMHRSCVFYLWSHKPCM